MTEAHPSDAEFRTLDEVIRGLIDAPLDDMRRQLADKIDSLYPTLKKLGSRVDLLQQELSSFRRTSQETADGAAEDRKELHESLGRQIQSSSHRLESQSAEVSGAQEIARQRLEALGDELGRTREHLDAKYAALAAEVARAQDVSDGLSRVSAELSQLLARNGEERREDITLLANYLRDEHANQAQRDLELLGKSDKTSETLHQLGARDQHYAEAMAGRHLKLLWITVLGVLGAWVATALLAWHAMGG